jgi:hypothetical protein
MPVLQRNLVACSLRVDCFLANQPLRSSISSGFSHRRSAKLESRGISGKMTKRKWSESDRLLILKSVIRVEEKVGGVIGQQVTRWEHVASLLPQRLRDRLFSTDSGQRCMYAFGNMLRYFRKEKQGQLSPYQVILTDPIRDLLKKREHFLNALNRNRANGLPKRRRSRNSSSGKKLYKQRNKSPCVEGPARFGKMVEDIPTSVQPSGSTSSFWSEAPTRVATAFGKANRPTSSAMRSVPRVRLKDAPFYAGEPCNRKRFQTRGSVRAIRGDVPCSLNEKFRVQDGSRALGKEFHFMAHTNRDEFQRGTLDGLQRRLDLEFCHLSSWMQSQAIPLMRKDVNEGAANAMNLCTRRQPNAHTAANSLDDLIQQCASRRDKLQFCASFLKLRLRLVSELRKSIKTLVHDILLSSYSRCSHQDSTSGVRKLKRSTSVGLLECSPRKKVWQRPSLQEERAESV